MLKSAVQIFAIRILGAGLTYASMILLARWLGAHDFGIYAYVLVIVTLLGIAFSFGFNSSGVRFVASYLARNRLRRLSGFLSFSHKAVAALALLGALAGAGLVLALKDIIEPYYVAPMLVGLLCVPVWALLNQMEATARAFGLVNVAYVPGYILRPLLMIVFSNATFGWIKASQKASYGQRYYSVDFSRTDHAKVAEAFGVKSWKVEKPGDLKGAFEAAAAHGGPALVDVITQPLHEAKAPVSEWVA